MPAPKNTGNHRRRRSPSVARRSASAENSRVRHSATGCSRPLAIAASAIFAPPLARTQLSQRNSYFIVVSPPILAVLRRFYATVIGLNETPPFSALRADTRVPSACPIVRRKAADQRTA